MLKVCCSGYWIDGHWMETARTFAMDTAFDVIRNAIWSILKRQKKEGKKRLAFSEDSSDVGGREFILIPFHHFCH